MSPRKGPKPVADPDLMDLEKTFRMIFPQIEQRMDHLDSQEQAAFENHFPVSRRTQESMRRRSSLRKGAEAASLTERLIGAEPKNMTLSPDQLLSGG